MKKRKKKVEKTKEQKRDEYLRKKYGISLDWYNNELKLNNGGCAICGRKPKEGKSLNVDHNHKTGQNRSILCYICNNKLIGPLERFNAEPYRVTYCILRYFEEFGTKDFIGEKNG